MSPEQKIAGLPSQLDKNGRSLDQLALWQTGYACLVGLFSLLYLVAAFGLVWGSSWVLLSASANLMFAFFNVAYFLGMAFYAYLNFHCAQLIKARRNSRLAIYIAGLNTMFFPVGTVLGVYAYRVLMRPAVNELFNNSAPTTAGVPEKKKGLRLVVTPEPTVSPALQFHEAMEYADAKEEALWKEIEEKHQQSQRESGGDGTV